MKDRIWKKEKAYIISLLVDYPHYEEHVERRKWELEHPVGQIDENVGGGKAQYKQDDRVVRMLIGIDEDTYLAALRREHFAIREAYEFADLDVQKICQEIYFKDTRYRKYSTIADMCNGGALHISQTVAYDKFDDFMHDLAQQLGMR